VRPPYRRNVAIGIAPAITTPAIPLGGNAIASEELAGRVLSRPAGPFHGWIVSALDHLEPSPNSATADASRPSSQLRSD
jgi:hypothetical protein